MRRRVLLLFAFSLILTGCIKIENIPVVTLTPTVSFDSYIAEGKLYAAITLSSATTVLVAGNVPIYYNYLGSASITNAETGEKLAETTIEEDGELQIFTISADTAGINDFIISASGEVSAYAGDKDNTYLTTAPYYGAVQYTLFVEELPSLTLNPSIVIFSNVIGKELNATVTIDANPTIQVQGNVPIIYQYVGGISLIDAGNPGNSRAVDFDDNGSIEVNRKLEVSMDTTGVDRFILKVDGQLVAFADNGIIGNTDDNAYLTSIKFYDENVIIINPE